MCVCCSCRLIDDRCWRTDGGNRVLRNCGYHTAWLYPSSLQCKDCSSSVYLQMRISLFEQNQRESAQRFAWLAARLSAVVCLPATLSLRPRRTGNRSFVRSFVRLFFRSFVPSFLPSFVRPFVRSFVRSFVCCALSFAVFFAAVVLEFRVFVLG